LILFIDLVKFFDFMYTESIIFNEKNQLTIVDQTLLPKQLKYIKINGLGDSVEAIKKLKVRGAPAIGIMAAYTLYVIAENLKTIPKDKFLKELVSAASVLNDSRPTAVNLSWAIERILEIASKADNKSVEITVEQIKNEALKIHEEDRESCRKIGENGLEIVPDNAKIITHCNAGSLATGGWGTALGVIYAAFENKKNVHVYIDETRPLGQGARLTLWELNQAGIPCTLITDSMAASLMEKKAINLVVFGADRIAGNGDVANKIGSYSLAVCANFHGIPCYSAAPLSTFDTSLKSGKEIPIENRDPNEILNIYNYENKENKLNVYNPAFDVTPFSLFSGIITEVGIIKSPINKNINNFIN
jgi:methylthioribose-1-phosphate isomerase